MAAIDTEQQGEPEFTVHGDMQTVAPLALRFTGSGSEYFRIWIVNLLLTVVTLSLYYPYARARRLRYFHANTLLDGQPLGFHGDPAKMLRGYLLVLGLVVVMQVASAVSPVLAGVVTLAFGALWPVLWWSSLRFRMANTSWRGLRMRFSGSVGGAYAALLAGPGALLLLLVAVGVLTATLGSPGRADGAAGSAGPSLAFALLPLGMLALVPFMAASVRRYQHAHLHYAAEDARFDAPVRAFYGLWFKTGAVSVAAALIFAVAVAGLFSLWFGGLSQWPDDWARPQRGASMASMVWPMLAAIAGWLALGTVVRSFVVARLQNLCWNHTRSQRIRFDSRLTALALGWLTLKNTVLTLLTLGLYRPFAVVATTRLRLQAVTVQVTGDPAQWASPHLPAGDDAAGDAAGDLLGVDLGL